MHQPLHYRETGRPIDVGPPPLLRDAPEERRLDATCGWGFSALGFGVGLVALGTTVGRTPLAARPAIEAAGIVVLAVAAIALRIVLKSRLPSFVLYDDRVVVYEKGRFDLVVPPNHIQPYHLQGRNTYRMMTGYFIVAFCGLCGCFAGFGGDLGGIGISSLGLFIGSIAGVVNAYYTRSVCRTYHVMTRTGVRRFMFRQNALHSVALSVRWFFVA